MTTSTKLILSCFALGILYVFYSLYLRGQIYMYKARKRIKEMERHCLKNISNTGFTLYIDNVSHEIKWREIKSIEFKTGFSLEIILRNGSKLMIQENCLNILEFIRKVPDDINKFDYAFVENFFAGLKLCKICGCYAIEDGGCLNCDYSEGLEKIYKEEKTEEEFCKEEQLDYFTTHFDENDSVETILRKAKQNELFKCDPHWKIYPTKEEIRQAQEEMK